jgi:superfamily II DNA or RNA helicase
MITELYDYQQAGKDAIRASFIAGNRWVIGEGATGCGKTNIACSILMDAVAKGKRCGFVVPTINLIQQTIESFERQGLESYVDMAVIQADHPIRNYACPIQICSKDTLANWSNFPDFDFIVVDEAHVTSRFMNQWKKARPNTHWLGLTATPWAKGMANVWDDLVVIARSAELIDRGKLSKFKVFAPTQPDLEGVDMVGDDYDENQVAERSSKPELIASIVDTWKKNAEGLLTFCYAVNRAHAKLILEDFRKAGVRTGYIDGFTGDEERKQLFSAIRAKEVDVVVNVNVLVAGADFDVRCIIIAFSTKSKIKFVQVVGRGLRLGEGKEYLIINDHSGNHETLGYVTDIYEDELDDGKPKKASKSKPQAPLPKPCPKCDLKPLLIQGCCPVCKFEAKPQGSAGDASGIIHGEGELVEITKKSKKKEYTAQETNEIWAMLKHYQIEKGKAAGWVYHTCLAMTGAAANDQQAAPIMPSAAVQKFIRHRNIAQSRRHRKT